MTEVTPETLQQSSEYAQELVDQGFRPNEVNMEAMMAQIAKLQSTVDALNAERGVPIDAVDGHRKHLWAHVAVRDAARPDVDMEAIKTLLSSLPEVSDNITARNTEALHFAMEQLVKAHPGKELDYLTVLTSELHQMVLNREGRSGVTHDRVTALETELAAMKKQFENLHAEMHTNG
jgi:hypothetical protein